MMRRVCAFAALLTLVSLGCDKKEAPPPASSESAAPAAPPTTVAAAAAPAEPVVDVASLPVEEQYEADAEQEISAANLTQKLDDLEKEIAEP